MFDNCPPLAENWYKPDYFFLYILFETLGLECVLNGYLASLCLPSQTVVRSICMTVLSNNVYDEK